MLINKKNLREFLLRTAEAERCHTYTSVSATMYHEADGLLRAWARRKVAQQPSKGKTIK